MIGYVRLALIQPVGRSVGLAENVSSDPIAISKRYWWDGRTLGKSYVLLGSEPAFSVSCLGVYAQDEPSLITSCQAVQRWTSLNDFVDAGCMRKIFPGGRWVSKPGHSNPAVYLRQNRSGQFYLL